MALFSCNPVHGLCGVEVVAVERLFSQYHSLEVRDSARTEDQRWQRPAASAGPAAAQRKPPVSL